MLIGESFSGKSSLISALSPNPYSSKRVMAVERHGQFINTPSEFLENRRFYHALITSAVDCEILAFVQDARRNSSLFPPLFAQTFNRRTIGIITNIDCPGAHIDRAHRFLANAGVQEIFATGVETQVGLEPLRQLLA